MKKDKRNPSQLQVFIGAQTQFVSVTILLFFILSRFVDLGQYIPQKSTTLIGLVVTIIGAVLAGYVSSLYGDPE